LRQKASAEDLQVASMDDAAVFGKVLHQLKFSQAIEQELLCDYQVVVVGVDDPSVQAEIERKSVVATLGGVTLDSQTLAHHIALSKAVKDYNLKKLITFHSSVKGARDFCEDHKKILESLSQKTESLQIGFVHGKMPTGKRTETINNLRTAGEKQVGIVTNARCLSEGVDVPSLDGVAFIDPRSSVVDIIQAVGRAIRKSNDKSHGFIILPVYLGGLEDDESEILKSRFADIWKVILALKSQDDALSASLDQIRFDAGKNPPKSSSALLPKKITLDLPESISSYFHSAISAKLVASTTDSWNEYYGSLHKFWEEHGHTRVPRKHVSGQWISKQRMERKKGVLPQHKIDLLDEIGFEWKIREGHFDYDELIDAFADYVKANGDGRIPHRTPVLGPWSNRMRTDYKKGKLSGEMIRKLESVGFIWDERQFHFDNMLAGVRQFQKETGEIPTCKHPLFGSWVDRRRFDYKRGKISPKNIAALEAIPGWAWVLSTGRKPK
jgi:hypothetical protein